MARDIDQKPFLKWAGNKFSIMDRILATLPTGERLVEPFVGSGAVFLNTDYPAYLLTDANADLISLYQILQQEGAEFIEYCRPFFDAENNTPDVYYAFREEFNTTADLRKKAALFLYFNRHGYNGLCRYNASGGFNVPFGRYKKTYFPEKEMLAFHQKAQRAVFQCADFTDTLNAVQVGDVVYCDPPYVPLTATACFTSYAAGVFGMREQQQLADLAEVLSQQGVPVVVSNHDTHFTQNAYRKAEIIPFQVQRFISCKGESRGKAGEVLAIFAAS